MGCRYGGRTLKMEGVVALDSPEERLGFPLGLLEEHGQSVGLVRRPANSGSDLTLLDDLDLAAGAFPHPPHFLRARRGERG